MRGSRVALVGLVVIGVVFFAGAGFGLAGGRQDKVDMDQPWLDGMHNLLVGDHQVALADLSADPPGCLQGEALVVLPGQLCSFEIGGGSAPARKLPLRLVQGTAAQIILQQKKKDTLTVKKTLTGPAPVEGLDVYGDGGTLFVICTG